MPNPHPSEEPQPPEPPAQEVVTPAKDSEQGRSSQIDVGKLLPKVDTSWIVDLAPTIEALGPNRWAGLFPKVDTSWIVDIAPQVEALGPRGLPKAFAGTDTSQVLNLVPKVDALHSKVFEPFFPRIDTSHLLGLFPYADMARVLDLTPKIEGLHIEGLAGPFAGIGASQIVNLAPKIEGLKGLDGLAPWADTSWIAGIDSLLPQLDPSWFEQVADLVRERVRSFPPNWFEVSALDALDDGKLRSIVLEEGIPLAWVPGPSLIERLLAAETAGDRRELIRSGWRGIVGDCVQAASSLPSRPGRAYARFISLSAEAIRDGHYETAQALSANIIDTLGNLYMKPTVSGYKWSMVTAKNHRPKLSRLEMRTLMVLGPLAVGHTAFHPDDAVPRAFSRHATTHAVSRRQYTRVNSLIALMNATTLLCWLERDRGAFETE